MTNLTKAEARSVDALLDSRFSEAVSLSDIAMILTLTKFLGQDTEIISATARDYRIAINKYLSGEEPS